MKNVLKRTIAGILLLVTVALNAQPGGPGGGTGAGGPPPSPGPSGAMGSTGGPIDGGATALLIGVAGYAYSQLKKKKDNENIKRL